MKQLHPVLAVLILSLAAVAADPPEKPAADEAGINPAAWEFLRAVDAGEAGRAYRMTTADYRESFPPETFKKEMDRLRGGVDLKALKRLQIFASPPPVAERPRRAIAVWPTSVKAEAKADRRRVTLLLHLSHEDGAWRVAGAGLDEGADYLRAFMKANPGSRPVPSAAAGMMGLTGVVTKLDEKSVTVEPVKPRPSEPAERTFSLDAGTRVLVPRHARDQKLPNGRTFRVYAAVPGKREDLKVGQQVSVEWPPDDQRAVRISIHHADVERTDGL